MVAAFLPFFEGMMISLCDRIPVGFFYWSVVGWIEMDWAGMGLAAGSRMCYVLSVLVCPFQRFLVTYVWDPFKCLVSVSLGIVRLSGCLFFLSGSWHDGLMFYLLI